MNIVTIAPHLHSIQSWIENMETRLENIDTDMTQLHKYELNFEHDVENLTDQLQEIVSNNKAAILLDLENIKETIYKIIHDLTGPVN